MGYRTVYWTLDSTDWRAEVTAEMVRERVLQRATDGAIVVLHVGSQATSETLPALLDELTAAGYRFVTMSELLEAELLPMAQPETFDWPCRSGYNHCGKNQVLRNLPQ
jgi:peptidoglycan/xylan/chitin deacetylase (PgdA/CDA1 family)